MCETGYDLEHVCTTLALFSLALACLACLAASFPQYPVKAVRDYPAAVERAGVVVAAVAVGNQPDQHTYFGISLQAKGYLPVFLVMKNETAHTSYLLDRQSLTYSIGKRSGSMSPSPSKASKADKAVNIAGNIPTVYTFMMAFAASKSKELRQNLLRAELQSATLSPGVSAHGFIFVPVHGKYPPPNQIRLTLPFMRSGTHEVMTIDLTI